MDRVSESERERASESRKKHRVRERKKNVRTFLMMRILFTTPFAIIAHYTLKIQHTTERKSFSFLFFPYNLRITHNFFSVLFEVMSHCFSKLTERRAFHIFNIFASWTLSLSNINKKISFLP